MNKFLAIDSSNAQEYNDDGEKLMCFVSKSGSIIRTRIVAPCSKALIWMYAGIPKLDYDIISKQMQGELLT